MTAKIDLARAVYGYAQVLDNLGASEYWCVADCDLAPELLQPNDQRTQAISSAIDRLQATGRSWSIAGGSVTCRVTWSGDCVITIRPLTLDVDNRVSPLLLLCNVFAPKPMRIACACECIPVHMRRELADDDHKALSRLGSKLRWPNWLLFLHLFLFSRSIEND